MAAASPGPLAELPPKCQKLAVDLLWYFPSLGEATLRSVALMALSILGRSDPCLNHVAVGMTDRGSLLLLLQTVDPQCNPPPPPPPSPCSWLSKQCIDVQAGEAECGLPSRVGSQSRRDSHCALPTWYARSIFCSAFQALALDEVRNRLGSQNPFFNPNNEPLLLLVLAAAPQGPGSSTRAQRWSPRLTCRSS